MIVLHEAGPACDHDVLDIWPWLKLGGANEHGGFSPDAIVLEEAVWLAEAFGEVRFRVSDIAVVKSFFLFHFFSLFFPFSSRQAWAHSPFATPFGDVASPETVMAR